jgi:valyl-tRNA synthetase
LTVDSKFKPGTGTPVATTAAGELFLVVEVDRTVERERLDKEIAKVEAELRTVGEKLKNKSFTERAPAAVVEEHRRRQEDFSAQLVKLKQARERLN